MRGYLPAVELAPGDRFPNFMLPDQTGATRSFLERAKGNPLLILGDGRDDALRALEATRKEHPEADCLALVAEGPAAAAKRAEALGLDFPLLGDSAGKIREALRRMLGFGPQGSFLVVLDANQRLIAARASPDGGELVRWAVDRLRARPPLPAVQSFGMAAPVLIVPDVLTPENCRALIDRWERLGHVEGEVHSIVAGVETSRVHRAMKSRRDHSIQDDSVLAELNAVIGRRIAPELDKAFAFQRFRFDRFNITCYDAERGDYFRRHRDNQSPATADRRFALTLNLNTGEYEGGELLFPEYGPYRYDPPAGAAILFSCSLLHEALPVTKGRRFTLLNFLRA
ncbi:MAG TPA: 2OG-Fe(II) oxygenase [Dongiaceae bacterium]|nr:2OG-Fe(II) oxygenase [Dongiaceae bacterium]